MHEVNVLETTRDSERRNSVWLSRRGAIAPRPVARDGRAGCDDSGRRSARAGDPGAHAVRDGARRREEIMRELTTRVAAVVLLAMAGGALTGCYYTVTDHELPESARLAMSPHDAPPYRIQVGDQLAVKFYQNRDLSETVVVRPDGRISLQLIGDVEAAGLEPSQLAAKLQELYASELTVPRPAVLVRRMAGRVYVGGEVGEPGPVPLTPNLTLMQAVQSAGGFLDTAHLSQVVLIRRRPDTGEPVGYVIDMRPVIGGHDPGRDVPLAPYDVTFVPRSKIADVNLFVKQYIRDNLPIEPAVGFIP